MVTRHGMQRQSLRRRSTTPRSSPRSPRGPRPPSTRPVAIRLSAHLHAWTFWV